MTQANYELFETFEKNSGELYWLAYLLTGNSERGVQAFDRALDFAGDENSGFDGFMNEWARKLVIVEALGTIRKELRASIERTRRLMPREDAGWTRRLTVRPEVDKEAFEEAVIAIDVFPRCAMLLTIYEGMPVSAAALLLNADEALTAAAQRMGILQLTRTLAGNSGGRDPYAGMIPVPVLSLS